MNTQEAEAVIQGFGKFMEVANGPLMLLFRSEIPETLLPYPKSVILEALTIGEEYFRQEGMAEMENAIGMQIAALEMYTDNIAALKQLVKHLEDPTFRKHLFSTFGSTQETQYANLIKQLG